MAQQTNADRLWQTHEAARDHIVGIEYLINRYGDDPKLAAKLEAAWDTYDETLRAWDAADRAADAGIPTPRTS